MEEHAQNEMETYKLVHEQPQQIVLLLRLGREQLKEVASHLSLDERQGVAGEHLDGSEHIQEPLFEPTFKRPDDQVFVSDFPLLVFWRLAFRLLQVSDVFQSGLVGEPDELAI